MNTTLDNLKWWERRNLLRSNRGALARVARQLGKDPSMVSKVFWGRATSRRVREAIENELGLSKEVHS